MLHCIDSLNETEDHAPEHSTAILFGALLFPSMPFLPGLFL